MQLRGPSCSERETFSPSLGVQTALIERTKSEKIDSKSFEMLKVDEEGESWRFLPFGGWPQHSTSVEKSTEREEIKPREPVSNTSLHRSRLAKRNGKEKKEDEVGNMKLKDEAK